MARVPTAAATPILTIAAFRELQKGDTAIVLVDCRFNLADLTWGKNEYATGHLPGAVYADLEQDLSGTIIRGKTGRHPLPEPHTFAAFLGDIGIDNNTYVVAYDDGSSMFAPRLWWLLHWLGHDKVSVLGGGSKAWLAANGSLESTIPTPQTQAFVATPNSSMVVELSDVETHVAATNRSTCLLDARAEPRFRGEHEPIDPVAGHIPHARNLPFTSLLEAGQPKAAPEVRALLEAVVAPYSTQNVVAYCGSGVTACALIWAAACAGISGLRLYPGSWSEWITSPTRPVARG